jgi:Icc-related predicted phosphoesterase
MTTIFFATDVHGSDVCWKKFINAGKFYGADVLILGGDMTGKAIVPIIDMGGGKFRAVLLEQEFLLDGQTETDEMIKKIKSRGYYPYKLTPDELSELNKSPDKVHELFLQEALKTAEQWMTFAGEKLAGTGMHVYAAPGNDDQFEVDDIIRNSGVVTLAEGQLIELDKHHEMISSGWSNHTPWHTYREETEDQLALRYESMITHLKNPKNAIFNIHVPPYASNLDEAAELDENLRPKYAGNALKPVGSTALRAAIEKNQPLLGLHGHIHEGRGSSRIGRTLCINPGSMYEQGTLLGVLVKLGKDKIENYVLTQG